MQDHVIELIKPYQESKTWQIRIAASRGLIELEFQCQGIDAALKLFIEYLNDETSLRGFSFSCSALHPVILLFAVYIPFLIGLLEMAPCDVIIPCLNFGYFFDNLVLFSMLCILNLLFFFIGQTKLGVCALRISQMTSRSDCDNDVKSDTLVALLRLLESPLAFNNTILRHYIFCILQVLAKRCVYLHCIP